MLFAAGACRANSANDAPATRPPSRNRTLSRAPTDIHEERIAAGGIAPTGTTGTVNPFAGDTTSIREGMFLFSSMNCDGCHGGGAVGWVGPSLTDGRWRYGGSDAEVFQSIYYGQRQGMPAYGGILQPVIVWKIVAYLRSLPLPKDVPTESW